MISRKAIVNYNQGLDSVFKELNCFMTTSVSFWANPNSIFDSSLKERQVEEVEVLFFELKREDYWIDKEPSILKLLDQYASRNLNPANPYELAVVNKNKSFTRTASNTTVWQSEDGEWQCLSLSRNIHGVPILSLGPFDLEAPFLEHFESYPRLFAGVL